jgi:succinate dehydrogenase / fumarate reductase cytochrome b subunit
LLLKIPVISLYAKTRGWPYILSWCHRISGLLVVAYIWLHIVTLSALSTPVDFNAKMTMFSSPLALFFEWLLAIPVTFHAINGGRLMLFEIFGRRDDDRMTLWVITLSILYVAILAVFMLLGTQSVSAVFFWLTTLITALIIAYTIWAKMRSVKHSLFWILQRICGAFLLVMIPAHFLFMHINPAAGKDAAVIISRLQNQFIQFVDILLVVAVCYHGGYGLYSVGKDYMARRSLQPFLATLVVIIMLVFVWVGIKTVVYV